MFYMRNLFLFRDPQKSARTTTAISNIIFSVLKQNLSMESRDKLISYRNLIVPIATHHATFIFERIEVRVRHLALLYY